MHAARGMSYPSAFYLPMRHESWGYVFVQVPCFCASTAAIPASWWLVRASEEAEQAIWSSFSVRGGLYEELAVGDIHVLPMETSTFDEIQS